MKGTSLNEMSAVRGQRLGRHSCHVSSVVENELVLGKRKDDHQLLEPGMMDLD